MAFAPSRSRWPLLLTFFRSFSLMLFLLLARWAPAQGPPRTFTTTVTVQGNTTRANIQVQGPGAGYNPSRVLVKFRAGLRDFLPGSGAARAFPLDPDLFLANNPTGLSVAEVMSRYKANPNVLY